MASATFNSVAIKGAAITLGENAHNFDDEPQYWNNDQNLLQRLKKTIDFGRRYTASPNATA
ncbi:MAG: hypothetical protein LBC09_06390 [Helicobacteraceae bacterium]|jgi:hypothetical protein|nr:hypothetical protein [Helicobacteraceae bacterium]